MRTVFISYRALDAELAMGLAECISSVGAKTYLDRRDPALDNIGVSVTEKRVPVFKSIRTGLQATDTLVAHDAFIGTRFSRPLP